MRILYLGKVPLDGVISLADVFREIGIVITKGQTDKLKTSLKLVIRYEENWDVPFSR